MQRILKGKSSDNLLRSGINSNNSSTANGRINNSSRVSCTRESRGCARGSMTVSSSKWIVERIKALCGSKIDGSS